MISSDVPPYLFNLKKKRVESPIPKSAGAADKRLNNTRRRDHFWSTCNKQHPQASITTNTCEHEQTTERRPLFNHRPTNFEGCKQARDRRKTGCLPSLSPGLHRRASPSAPPSFYSASDGRGEPRERKWPRARVGYNRASLVS